ncbi:MAG: hypothetical protein JSW00_07085 [Thermoplasmata archaeon]|nr:MAG: hypothetical protein JSW00_07085 [Thermoplasmata archaeon]
MCGGNSEAITRFVRWGGFLGPRNGPRSVGNLVEVEKTRGVGEDVSRVGKGGGGDADCGGEWHQRSCQPSHGTKKCLRKGDVRKYIEDDTF